MPLTFLVLFIFELFHYGNGNDLFQKPWLCSRDLICKLLNAFHTDGVKESQNYIAMNSAFAPHPAIFPSWLRFHHYLSSLGIFYVCFVNTLLLFPEHRGKRGRAPERIELFQVPQYRSSLYFLWRKTISHLYKLSISMPLEQNSWYSTPFLQNKINYLLWLNSTHSIFSSSLSSIPFIHYLLLPCCLLAAHPVCLFQRYASYWNSTQPNSDDVLSS